MTNEDVDQEKQVRQLFKECSGYDMQIDAFELREILNGQFSKGVLLLYPIYCPETYVI